MGSPRLISSSHQPDLVCLPYGVGHDREGVCLLVKMGEYRILLDCGLPDISPLLEEKDAPADLVFCSHAHGDHARGLLDLHDCFPDLPIYGSEATAELLHLNWLEQEQINPIPRFCQTLPWRSPVHFFENLQGQLFPAGHLPGAAALLLTYTTPQRAYTLLYTGDFFLSNSRLVEGLSLETLRGSSPDVLIVEGSYGTARHPRRRQLEKQLMSQIDRAIAENYSVLLPVPPLGLGQEILMLLRSHHQFTGRNLDIWVTDPVATVCDDYLNLLPHLPTSVQNFARHQPLFWDEQVLPRVRRLDPDHWPELGETPAIVLVDQGAPWPDYVKELSGAWVILVPEKLRPHATWYQSLPPDLSLETYLLAEHSDGRNTTQLIHNIRPQHVLFIHGTPTDLADLTSLEELQNRYHLHCPNPGTLVELPVGDRFIQPAAPTDTHYEGEINEIGATININLPGSITQTPRWNSFADTGLVEARWQGEELVLRGISQRELLSQSNNAKLQASLDCCRNCLHQRGQRCYNPASPLYGFKVTPEGYCPVFETKPESEDLSTE